MSETKPPRLPHLEDLSVRARRGDLSSGERGALDRVLDMNPELRLEHRFGRDFDEELCVRPGDDALILRAAERTFERPKRHRSKSFALLLGLAASLLVSTAAALALWTTHHNTPALPAPKVAAGHLNAATAATAPPQASATRSAPAIVDNPAPSASASEPHPSARAAASRRPPSDAAAVARSDGSAAPLASAAELFRAAGSARRAGDVTRARSLYAELAVKFPSSHEARVSRVSLGKLLLEAGRPSEADRTFASYLAEGDRVLEEEALVGRAEALSRMGNTSEEIRVWRELLRGHPSSVYRRRAEQRLRALDATTALTRDGS